MDINLVDAKSTATGLGGLLQRIWRPPHRFQLCLSDFLGICFEAIYNVFSAVFEIETFPLPSLDMGVLMPLVMSLLGMATLRTYEKQKGLSK